MDEPKERHGCLTAWLVLLILSNGLTAYCFLAPKTVEAIQQEYPSVPNWVFLPIAVLAVLNLIFIVAIYNWKKWGFYGFVGINLTVFVLNLYAGIGVWIAVSGLVFIAILYGVLRIGGEKSGWSQLE